MERGKRPLDLGRFLLFLIAMTLWDGRAWAAEYAELHFSKGVSSFNEGRLEEALQEFQQAEEHEPKRAMVPFFRGYSHYLRKEFNRSFPYFKRARELDPTLKQNAHFHSGMAYRSLERFPEAKEAFQAAVEADPQTDLALAAQRYLEGIEERKRLAKRWSLCTNLAFQYHDNVNLEPTESSVLPRDLNEDEKDFRPAFFLTREYKLLKRWGWESALRYTFYQSIHSRLHDFDYQNHQGLLSISRQGRVRKMPYQIHLDYGYTNGLSSEARYLEGHGVGATFSLMEKARYRTQLQYRFQNRDFHFKIRTPSFNRDSNNHALALTQFLFSANRTGYLKLGYAFDIDRAQGDNWDYQGHRLFLGL